MDLRRREGTRSSSFGIRPTGRKEPLAAGLTNSCVLTSTWKVWFGYNYKSKYTVRDCPGRYLAPTLSLTLFDGWQQWEEASPSASPCHSIPSPDTHALPCKWKIAFQRCFSWIHRSIPPVRSEYYSQFLLPPGTDLPPWYISSARGFPVLPTRPHHHNRLATTTRNVEAATTDVIRLGCASAPVFLAKPNPPSLAT